MLLSSMKTAETQVRSLDVQCPHCRVTMRLMRHINLTGMTGSVVEVIEEGVSGFIVETLEEAVAAVSLIGSLERARVRAAFERRFTAERMARDYARIYQALFTSHFASSDPSQVLSDAGG